LFAYFAKIGIRPLGLLAGSTGIAAVYQKHQAVDGKIPVIRLDCAIKRCCLSGHSQKSTEKLFKCLYNAAETTFFHYAYLIQVDYA
jgi:hypothetical protein